MTMDIPTNQTSHDIWDGNTISPEFALALKKFLGPNTAKAVKSGTASIAGNSGDTPIAHGLGAVPNFISWNPNPFWDSSNGLSVNYLSATAPDATNFYVQSRGALTRSAIWYAAIL